MSNITNLNETKTGSLSVVGVGLKAISHITHESKQKIVDADHIYYLVDNPIIEKWIININKASYSLSDFYKVGEDRLSTYNKMARKVLESVIDGSKVCMVLYGHPGVCSLPGHIAIEMAKLKNINASMSPGISALDCLVADLGIDIVSTGFQSYGATNFITSLPNFDPCFYLILWQVGMVGDSDYQLSFNASKIDALCDSLEKYYEKEHIITYYEASSHLLIEPMIKHVQLQELRSFPPDWRTTVIIPPRKKPVKNSL